MSKTIALASAVRVKEEVLFRDLEGEIVLLNLQTGIYFGLDAVGTRIWHLIREHGVLQKVLDALVEEYAVSERRCEDDLLAFVGQLRENKLIELDP